MRPRANLGFVGLYAGILAFLASCGGGRQECFECGLSDRWARARAEEEEDAARRREAEQPADDGEPVDVGESPAEIGEGTVAPDGGPPQRARADSMRAGAALSARSAVE